MTAHGHAALRQLALRMLAHRAGPADRAEAITAAASLAYDDLARVLAPVIGDVGVTAITDRALHLALREYPWVASSCEPASGDTTFAHVIDALKSQDREVTTEAAAAVFATFLGLLATFIGETL